MPAHDAAPIAIIGAGPCGLTFARLLEKHGINYVVFERDESSAPTTRSQGGTLDIHGPTGQEALRVAGIFDEFNKLARWDATRLAIRDSAGDLVFNSPEDRDAPEIDRVQLRHMLLDSIPQEKVRWGYAVKTVEKASEGPLTAANWIIHFSNGSTESGFRLVVGADGAWSKLRALLTSAKPEFSGKLFIEGRITQGNPRYADAQAQAGPGTMLSTGHGRMLAVQQLAEGSYRVYLGLKGAEDLTRTTVDVSDTEATRKQLLESPEFFPLFSDGLRNFIADAEGPFRAWNLYRMPISAMSWARVPGVTLLGDAAHVSTPFVGEGVNCAMFDALRLAQCIIKHCDAEGRGGGENDAVQMERALAEYEEEMFARAKDLISRSIASEGILFSADSAARFRDAILGTDGAKVYMQHENTKWEL